jgi:hypothetical protein
MSEFTQKDIEQLISEHKFWGKTESGLKSTFQSRS